MVALGQLPAANPVEIADINDTIEQLFHGPLPAALVDLAAAMPLFPGLDELIDKANEMIDTFNSNNWRYGPGLFMIRGAVERVLEILPTLVERLEYALDHYTPVISLYRVAGSWTSEAMTPLSEVAGEIDREIDNTSLRDWTDAARDKYSEDIVPHQHNAVSAARDNAAYISNMLSEIGTANVQFATGLVETLGKVLAKLVVIIAECLSGVGAPFAIQDAAGLIEEAINGFIGVVTDAIDNFAGAVERIQNAENELSDHTYFPGGMWPEAVSRA